MWGIDVGRCALKAVKLRPGADGAMEVVAAEYIEHEKILSQPDADRPELISSALEKFLSRNDLSKDKVVVSVPGQHTLARFTKLPPVAPKRIPDIVRYEADQQIPFDMDEVIWDYQTFKQEDMPDIEVGIFAMKRELIREHLLHFEQAGIEPVAVQAGPLAVYSAAHFDEVLAADTTVIVDIGADNTDLVIATPHSLWTRNVQIGGNTFTDALVKAFKLSFSKAENLKRTANDSKYARQVFQAMRPVFADLVQELQRSIGFYSSTHRDADFQKVLLVGNAFNLPGLQKYLQQNLGMDTEVLDGLKKSKGSGDAASLLEKHKMSFYTAYGLALQGLEKSPIESNLLPIEIAKAAVWRRKKPFFGAAAACLVLAGGLIWFRQITDSSALAANSSGQPPSQMSLEEASRIIDQGVVSAPSDRVLAQTVVAAANTMSRELNNRKNMGVREREETTELIDLLENKSVVPRLLDIVNAAVPRPSGELADAGTAEEMRKAVASAGDRSSRNRVWITSLDTQYDTDLQLFNWTSLVNTGETFNVYTGDGAAVSGIRLTIGCRTPNKGGVEYLKGAFLDKLIELGRKPGMGFYFDKVSLIRGGKVQVSSGASATRPGGGFRGRGTTGTAAPAGGTDEQLPPEAIDPVTLEPWNEDWSFDVWVAVILEDYPGSDEADDAIGGGGEDTGD